MRRCTIMSSSENAHTEPLRKGEAFCMHHQRNEPSQEECNEPSQEEEFEGRYITPSPRRNGTVMTASVSLGAMRLDPASNAAPDAKSS